MRQGRWSAARQLLRRKAVRRLLLLLVIASALAFLAPKARRVAGDWSRDELRRRATAALVAASGGKVAIEEAVVVSLRQVRLTGVRLTDMAAFPEVASLVMEEVILVPGGGESVTGSWAVIESITATGAVLTLRSVGSGSAAPARPSAPPVIGRLVVRDSLLLLDGAGGVGALGVEGEMRDIGGQASGDFNVRSHRVPLKGALAAFVPAGSLARADRVLALVEPCCGALEARARLMADGSAEIEGEFEIPEGSLGGEPATSGSFHARAEPPDAAASRAILASLQVPGLVSGSVRLASAPQGTTWSDARIAFARLTPAMLRDEAPKGVAWSEASVEAEATPAAGGMVDVSLEARARDLLLGKDLRFDELRLRATGLASDPLAFDGDVALSISDRGVDELVLRGAARIDAEARATLTYELASGALVRHPELLGIAGTSFPAGWKLQRHDALRGRIDGRWIVATVTAATWTGDMRRAHVGWRVTREGRETLLDVALAASAASEQPGAPPSWRADGVVTSPSLPGLVRFQASHGAGAGAPLDASGTIEGLDARAALRQFAPPSMLEGIPASATLGEVSGEFTATRDASQAWTADASLDLAGLAAQSADFTRALSLPRVPITLRARLAPDGAWDGRITADLAQGQVLWGSAFADLARLGPRVEATVRAPPGGADWDAEIAASAAGDMTARARLRPSATREGVAGDLALGFPDVASAWRALGDSGLLAAASTLADFAPSGSVRVALAGSHGASADSLDGTVTVDGGALAHGPSGLKLGGLVADLPVRLERAARDAPWRLASAARTGRIRAGSVAILGARAESVDVPVLVGEDGLSVGADIAFSVLGGQAVLQGVKLEKPLEPERALSAGLSLTGLRLEELGPVGPFRLAGSISANLPRVSASATRLDVQGGARISAWGGEIVVDGIAGENPWSRLRRTRIAATLHDIDLLQLTSTFGFGAMTGLVEGEVRSFELLGSTPVRFDASVRSAPGDEPRSISIPALQNLATLATGGRAPLFDKGLLKLVGRLRYEELGARATLQADEFMLRGLAERNGRELFLKGRLPLRVDVANAEPGATVSFRAMMNRLQGLEEPEETPR